MSPKAAPPNKTATGAMKGTIGVTHVDGGQRYEDPEARFARLNANRNFLTDVEKLELQGEIEARAVEAELKAKERRAGSPSGDAASPSTPKEPTLVEKARAAASSPDPLKYDLSAGAKLQGPLLVAEETTTILVGSGDHLRVDAYGNYLITLAGISP